MLCDIGRTHFIGPATDFKPLISANEMQSLANSFTARMKFQKSKNNWNFSTG
jgi:hypothetical protein